MKTVAGTDPVPLWRLFWRMGGWSVLIPGALTLFLTIFSSGSLSLAERFDAEGRETAGDVIDKYERTTTDSDGDRKTNYYLQIAFDTDTGEEVRVTRSVGWSIYRDTTVGDRIPLWYLETEPQTIELSRGENRSASRVTQVIALIGGIASLVLLWIFGNKAVAAVRARRYGRRETAVVTAIEETNTTVNKRRLYRLTWREQSGRIGSSLGYFHEVLSDYPPGTEITVYQGLKRAWWTGDVGERKGLEP